MIDFRQTEYTILPYLELVECMGEIYDVVPAGLGDSLGMDAADLQQRRPEYYESAWVIFFAPEFEYMPLQFYIFQLEGASLVHGALRIELPRSRSDIHSRNYGGHVPDVTSIESLKRGSGLHPILRPRFSSLWILFGTAAYRPSRFQMVANCW